MKRKTEYPYKRGNAFDMESALVDLKSDDTVAIENAIQAITENVKTVADGVAYKELGDPVDAAECVQDTLSKLLWEGREKLPSAAGKAQQYIMRAVKNAAINYHRIRARRQTDVTDFGAMESPQEDLGSTMRFDGAVLNGDAFVKPEDRKSLISPRCSIRELHYRDAREFAMRGLSDRDSKIFMSIYRDGLSYKEASEIYELKETTLRGIVNRARKQVITALASEGIVPAA